MEWSLDELIEYKHNGQKPHRLPDQEILFKLGSVGVSAANCCALFDIGITTFNENPDWRSAWERGRATIATRLRSSLIEDALEKDNVMVKIYLDKVLGGEKTEAPPVVNVTVNNAETLQQVSTEE